ncbi:MAG: phosphoglucosamine mutase [Acidimicrobiales bacterium]
MLSFGTDGIRGVANTELTPEIALGLGRAVVELFNARTVLVGRDTRLSGDMLASAFAAGVTSQGAEVHNLSVLPTGGIAFAAALRGAPAAVISASHNPFADNGIKIFDAKGRKLHDDVEERLEHRLTELLSGVNVERSTSVGRIVRDRVDEEYLQFLATSFTARSAGGFRLVIDCANGAASEIAPSLFESLGFEIVEVIGVEPDGRNINAGVGSTDVGLLREAVVSGSADLGLAFDGDADRLVAVDDEGEIIDGDVLLALFAQDLDALGALRGGMVVATIMSNLGLEIALDRAGISLLRCPVGDRYVLEKMEQHDVMLGGEQSGHIIFRDEATTGDGLLSAVKLVDLVVRRGERLSRLRKEAMVRLPQVLLNLRVDDPRGVMDAASVVAVVDEGIRELGADGRIIVRASGTEPKIRVMVEAPTYERAHSMAERIGNVVKAAARRAG